MQELNEFFEKLSDEDKLVLNSAATVLDRLEVEFPNGIFVDSHDQWYMSLEGAANMLRGENP